MNDVSFIIASSIIIALHVCIMFISLLIVWLRVLTEKKEVKWVKKIHFLFHHENEAISFIDQNTEKKSLLDKNLESFVSKFIL